MTGRIQSIDFDLEGVGNCAKVTNLEEKGIYNYMKTAKIIKMPVSRNICSNMPACCTVLSESTRKTMKSNTGTERTDRKLIFGISGSLLHKEGRPNSAVSFTGIKVSSLVNSDRNR